MKEIDKNKSFEDIKHILQFKLESKKLVKKNIVYLLKMKKDFIKEI